jgi:cytochrome c553
VTNQQHADAQQRGQAIYAVWCASCHDAGGLHLVKDPPTLRGVFLRKTLPSGAPATDAQVRKTISEGLGIMPPFRQTLNADEIDDLVVFLRSLKANSGNADAMRARWKHLGYIFTQVVEAMPEDKYDFRPTKKSSSFRDLVMRAIEDNYTNMGYVAGKSRQESEKLVQTYKNITTRAGLLDALEDSYDYGDMVLADLNDQNASDMVTGIGGERTTRVGAALQAFADTMDHYGNLVVYLRLNGIVPPDMADDVGKAIGPESTQLLHRQS